eukprot:IDg14071t1
MLLAETFGAALVDKEAAARFVFKGQSPSSILLDFYRKLAAFFKKTSDLAEDLIAGAAMFSGLYCFLVADFPSMSDRTHRGPVYTELSLCPLDTARHTRTKSSHQSSLCISTIGFWSESVCKSCRVRISSSLCAAEYIATGRARSKGLTGLCPVKTSRGTCKTLEEHLGAAPNDAKELGSCHSGFIPVQPASSV